MTEIYTLKSPINALSGETIKELKLDFDGLTARDYRQIVHLESKLRGDQPSFTISSLSKKTSAEFRIATSWVAALKGTKGLCLDDYDKISLQDVLELEEFGAFFTAGVE